MGKRDALDNALASFSFAYAAQNHEALERSVRKGEVKAVFEKNR